MKTLRNLFCLALCLALAAGAALTSCTVKDATSAAASFLTPSPSPVSPTPTPTPTPTPVTPTPTPTPETPTPTPTPETPTPTPSPVTPTPTPTPVTPTPVTPTPVTPTPTPSPTTPDPEPKTYTPFYPTEKVVAFTFDDGPYNQTPAIIDVIDGTGDKITFFVTGYMMDANKVRETYVKRAFDLGCEIGLHTYDHKNLYNSSKKTDASSSVINYQLGAIDERVQSIIGQKTYLMRPPGGNFNRKRNYGYASILWSLDTKDWKFYSDNQSALTSSDASVKNKAMEEVSDAIVKRILDNIRPGDIVLMHDLYPTTALAFKKVYPILKEQGYRLVTVSELLGINAADYTGWCFFSTGSAGYNNKSYTAKRSAPAVTLALPPAKFD